jgi:hypothetical protein
LVDKSHYEERGLWLAHSGFAVAIPKEAKDTYPTLESPRAFIEIRGRTHFGICDENNPAGAHPDPAKPKLDQEASVSAIALWAALWLRANLENDHVARQWLYRIGGSIDGVVKVLAEGK